MLNVDCFPVFSNPVTCLSSILSIEVSQHGTKLEALAKEDQLLVVSSCHAEVNEGGSETKTDQPAWRSAACHVRPKAFYVVTRDFRAVPKGQPLSPHIATLQY
jgi:hypothetical protein